MLNMENPSALAGATGVEKSIHAKAEDLHTIAYGNAKYNDLTTRYRLTSSDDDACRTVVKSRNLSSFNKSSRDWANDFTFLAKSTQREVKLGHDLRQLGLDVEIVTIPHECASLRYRTNYFLCSYVTANPQRGLRMTKMQILYLRRLHGLNEAQAHALAVLIWGAGE